jgi:hypothetical protein
MSVDNVAPYGCPSEGFVKETSGAKIGRLYYETKEQAEAAIPIIAKRRDKALERGYDFGYMWPTDIYQEPSSGHWVIVTP